MNHRKRATALKKWKKTSLRGFGVPGPRTRRRRRLPRRYAKPNHWHQESEHVFSKIVIRDVELLWLQEQSPKATVSVEYVKNYKSYPLYKSGQWDGKAYFVRFPKDALNDSIMFRILWWNTSV